MATKTTPETTAAAEPKPQVVEKTRRSSPKTSKTTDAAAPATPRKQAARKTPPASKAPAESPKVGKAKTKGPAHAAAKGHAKPRAKLVRDSFTMPQADFALIDTLKQRALEFKRPTKKSELLRAGLQALADLSAKALEARLAGLVELKTGRPRKAG